MSNKILKTVAGGMVAAVVAAVAVVPEAKALTTACSTYIANSVTGYVSDPDTTNTTCGVSTTGNNDSVAELNSELLGGISNWSLIGSVGIPTSDLTVSPGLTGTDGADTYTNAGGDLLGTWSIASSLYSTYEVVALVFKDGKGDPGPDSWIGYLTNLANSNGMFRSPFLNGTNPKDISHFSLYGVISTNCPPTNPACGGQQAIPLPAAFPLFATALGGLGLLGWRRRRKAAV